MIAKENLDTLLRYFEFTQRGNIFRKEYPQGASIEVNFDTQKIIYAPLDNDFKEAQFPSKDHPSKGFVIHRDTTLNFSQKENFVCLVCVHLLLKKGYEPKHIVFEPAFKSGHVNKPSYGDILVFDKEYNPLVLIENKTYGAKFSEEWNNMLKDGGQLFSYLGGMSQSTGYCEHLILYSADFDDKLIQKSHIITLKDSEKRIKELDNPKTFSNTKDKLFDVWSETYAKSFETKGLFENDIEAYSIGKLKYKIEDLESLSHAEIRPVYHEFATILRNHAITDFEHSFYILIDLFLCKITDELKNPQDLQFYYRGITRDTPKEYCARLLNLYQQGKKLLFGVEVVNKNESDISRIFEEKQRTKNGLYEGIKELFEEIKFYNIKKFNFIDVENRDDFEMNFQILIEVTALIQDIKLSESETNHFFGDLFEGLLSKNVHQTEGQFFTPLPIVNFIIKSLPHFPNDNTIKVLDYACGAGHFLTEFVKAYPKANVYGIEKSQPLSQVSKIATIINGAKDSHIVFKDALSIMNTKEYRFQGFDKNSFDCLIANPPYSVDGFLSTLSENDRKKFQLTSTVDEKSIGINDKIQCFFIERAEHFLRNNGLMSIILPTSILSNSNDSIFAKTRELLFANFNILSIVSLNSRTFGSTGTNTIILFAQKVVKNSDGLLDSFIKKKEIISYTNHKAIDAYIEKQEYDKNDYYAFMQDNTLNEKLENHEIFVEYRRKFKKHSINKTMQKEWFKSSALFRNDLKEKSKDYKKCFEDYLISDDYKLHEEYEQKKQFIEYAKEIEKDKLNTFIQIEKNKVAVLISPPDKINNKSNKEQVVKFLGYDWSSRKNDEGIKYVTSKPVDDKEYGTKKKNDKDAEVLAAINSIKYIETPLYNPNDVWDNSKFAFVIRKHIYRTCNMFSCNINHCVNIEQDYDGDMNDLLSFVNLTDMIKFDLSDFDKTIHLKPDKKIEINSKYTIVKMREVVNMKGGDTFKKIYQGNSNSEDIPFFKVGDMNTPGNERDMTIANNYVSENILKDKLKASIFEAGTVVFPKVGMAIHTDKKRMLGRKAAIDNNTMAVWVKDSDKTIPDYIYYYFVAQINLSYIASESNPPSINARNLSVVPIPLPPLEIQNQIVKECRKVDEEFILSRMTTEAYKGKIAGVFEKLEVIIVQKKSGSIL